MRSLVKEPSLPRASPATGTTLLPRFVLINVPVPREGNLSASLDRKKRVHEAAIPFRSPAVVFASVPKTAKPSARIKVSLLGPFLAAAEPETAPVLSVTLRDCRALTATSSGSILDDEDLRSSPAAPAVAASWDALYRFRGDYRDSPAQVSFVSRPYLAVAEALRQVHAAASAVAEPVRRILEAERGEARNRNAGKRGRPAEIVAGPGMSVIAPTLGLMVTASEGHIRGYEEDVILDLVPNITLERGESFRRIKASANEEKGKFFSSVDGLPMARARL